MSSTLRALVLACATFVAGLALGACSPSSRETIREVTPPATRALCILLRAVTNSGTLDEVCATAEELAPFVPEILARRESGETPRTATQSVQVAAAFEAPPRPVARRRCVSWVSLAGSKDGDSSRIDAAARDAGSAEAGSNDGAR